MALGLAGLIVVVIGLWGIRTRLKTKSQLDSQQNAATENQYAATLSQDIQSLRDENAKLQKDFLEFKQELKNMRLATPDEPVKLAGESEVYTAEDVYAILADALKNTDEDITVCMAEIINIEEQDDAVWIEYQPYTINRRGVYEATGRNRRNSVYGIKQMSEPFSGLCLLDEAKKETSMQAVFDGIHAQESAPRKALYEVIVTGDVVSGLIRSDTWAE